MPPLLVRGIVRPGMGPPGRGPLWPPRPACFPRELRANREVSVRPRAGGAERWRLRAEAGKARAPAPGEKQGRPKTAPAPPSAAHMASPWLLTFRTGDRCSQEPSQRLPPRSSPLLPADCTCFSTLQLPGGCFTLRTHRGSRWQLPVEASGAQSPAGVGPRAGLRCSDSFRG